MTDILLFILFIPAVIVAWAIAMVAGRFFMTEITEADRDAAAQYDVVEAFARHRLAERAAIVAWLDDQHDIYNPSDNWSAYWAECIEAGEHLK